MARVLKATVVVVVVVVGVVLLAAAEHATRCSENVDGIMKISKGEKQIPSKIEIQSKMSMQADVFVVPLTGFTGVHAEVHTEKENFLVCFPIMEHCHLDDSHWWTVMLKVKKNPDHSTLNVSMWVHDCLITSEINTGKDLNLQNLTMSGLGASMWKTSNPAFSPCKVEQIAQQPARVIRDNDCSTTGNSLYALWVLVPLFVLVGLVVLCWIYRNQQQEEERSQSNHSIENGYNSKNSSKESLDENQQQQGKRSQPKHCIEKDHNSTNTNNSLHEPFDQHQQQRGGPDGDERNSLYESLDEHQQQRGGPDHDDKNSLYEPFDQHQQQRGGPDGDERNNLYESLDEHQQQRGGPDHGDKNSLYEPFDQHQQQRGGPDQDNGNNLYESLDEHQQERSGNNTTS